jgi:hypothetical protein
VVIGFDRYDDDLHDMFAIPLEEATFRPYRAQAKRDKDNH